MGLVGLVWNVRGLNDPPFCLSFQKFKMLRVGLNLLRESLGPDVRREVV